MVHRAFKMHGKVCSKNSLIFRCDVSPIGSMDVPTCMCAPGMPCLLYSSLGSMYVIVL